MCCHLLHHLWAPIAELPCIGAVYQQLCCCWFVCKSGLNIRSCPAFILVSSTVCSNRQQHLCFSRKWLFALVWGVCVLVFGVRDPNLESADLKTGCSPPAVSKHYVHSFPPPFPPPPCFLLLFSKESLQSNIALLRGPWLAAHVSSDLLACLLASKELLCLPELFGGWR